MCREAEIMERARAMFCCRSDLENATPEQTRAAQDLLCEVIRETSMEALAYVWLSVMGAYLWTDYKGMDVLSDEEFGRYSLIGFAVKRKLEVVKYAMERALVCDRTYNHTTVKIDVRAAPAP